VNATRLKDKAVLRRLQPLQKPRLRNFSAGFVARHVTAGTVISADESTAYNVLHAKFKMERVNHSIEYMGKSGENTHQAESFFSRFRRI